MKTMYIHKKQLAEHMEIYAKNIVVNGMLKVEGKIVADHISGKGIVEAGEISAKTISIPHVKANHIVANELLCNKAFAEIARVRDKLTAKEYIEADRVECNALVLTQSDIQTVDAVEVVNLEPKKRGILGLAFAAWLRSTVVEFCELFQKGDNEVDEEDEITMEELEDPFAEADATTDVDTSGVDADKKLLDAIKFIKSQGFDCSIEIKPTVDKAA